MKTLIAMLVIGAGVAVGLAGCESSRGHHYGLPAPHSYTPQARDQKAYDFVHSHDCEESHHAAGNTWNIYTNQPERTDAFDVYYCSDVDDLIFVHEEPLSPK